jgi:four helix bundle protein
MEVKDFRDLRVWQDAMDLVVGVYAVTQAFPSHETYGLTSQIRRAAVSMPSNIAEGKSRNHIKEYLHHVSIARGSVAELHTQLEIAARLEYVSAAELQALNAQVLAVARQLTKLKNALASKL